MILNDTVKVGEESFLIAINFRSISIKNHIKFLEKNELEENNSCSNNLLKMQ